MQDQCQLYSPILSRSLQCSAYSDYCIKILQVSFQSGSIYCTSGLWRLNHYGLRFWHEHDLAIALLEQGGSGAMGAAAELTLG